MFTKILDRLDFLRRMIINFFFVIFLTIFLIGLFIFPFFSDDNVDVKGHILSLKTNDISDKNSSYLNPQSNLTIYEVVKAFEIASEDDDVEIIFIDNGIGIDENKISKCAIEKAYCNLFKSC